MTPRRLSCALLTVAVAVACLAATGPASASTAWPAKPTGTHVAAATMHSFTISMNRAANAQRYVVLASATKSEVYYENLTRTRKSRVSSSSATPKVTIRGLKYTTAAFYYRVETKNGSHFRVSSIRVAHLAPAVPAHVAVANVPLALTWNVASVLGYDVIQATNPALTRNRRAYSVQGAASGFTPYRLTPGTTYYFRIRARNGTSKSAYSATVARTYTGREQPLRVLTYNVLHKQFDGTKEHGNTIAPWSQRLPAAVALIKSGAPDVLSIQEASDWVNAGRHIRAIDTLVGKLGSGYTLARTDTLPNPRTGNYIVYRNSAYRAVGGDAGRGYHAVSRGNYVSYQELQNTTSGATFLFVAVHLSHGGDSVDAKRKRETSALLSFAHAKAQTLARTGQLPIIYAGDFNSSSGRLHDTLDSPEQLMRAAHVADALVAVQSRANTGYGSVNNYTRVPNKSGRVIDHVFGESGVALQTWRQLLHLKHGRFVGTIPSDHNPVVVGLSVQY